MASRLTQRYAISVESDVFSAKFSPDGTLLATGCNDGRVRLYDARTGAAAHAHVLDGVAADRAFLGFIGAPPSAPSLLAAAGERLPVTCVRWRPGAGAADAGAPPVVLAVSADGAVRHWDARSGFCLSSLMEVPLDEAPAAGVDPDTAYVRVGGVGAGGGTSTAVKTALGGRLPHQIFAADFRPDGAQFATAGKDKAVRVYDEATAACVVVIAGGGGHGGAGHVVAGAHGAAPHAHGGGPPGGTPGHSNRVFALAWHPTNPFLIASTGWDGTVHVSDTRTGFPVRSVFGAHVCGDALTWLPPPPGAAAPPPAAAGSAAGDEDDGAWGAAGAGTLLTASWRDTDAVQAWPLAPAPAGAGAPGAPGESAGALTLPWGRAGGAGSHAYALALSRGDGGKYMAAGGSGGNEVCVWRTRAALAAVGAGAGAGEGEGAPVVGTLLSLPHAVYALDWALMKPTVAASAAAVPALLVAGGAQPLRVFHLLEGGAAAAEGGAPHAAAGAEEAGWAWAAGEDKPAPAAAAAHGGDAPAPAPAPAAAAPAGAPAVTVSAGAGAGAGAAHPAPAPAAHAAAPPPATHAATHAAAHAAAHDAAPAHAAAHAAPEHATPAHATPSHAPPAHATPAHAAHAHATRTSALPANRRGSTRGFLTHAPTRLAASSPRPRAPPPGGWASLPCATRVHGAWYDLASFAHPGGPVALSCAFGRDATLLFESYHALAPRGRLAAALAACALPPDASAALDAARPAVAAPSPYDFDTRAAAAALGVAPKRAAVEGEGEGEGADDARALGVVTGRAGAAGGGALCGGAGVTTGGGGGGGGARGSRPPTPARPAPARAPASEASSDGSASDDGGSRGGSSGSRGGSRGGSRAGRDAADASSASASLSRASADADGEDDAVVADGEGGAEAGAARSAGGAATPPLAAAARGAPAAPAAPAVDAFEAEVKAIALAYFTAEAARRGVSLRAATKAPPSRWIEIAALTAAFILGGALPLVRGWWPALVVTPTLAWLWMVNFWHDAAHFAMSPDWRVNAALTYAAPWFSSPLIWYHQHVIGHHAHTNIPGRDPDLYHAPRFWRFHRGQRHAPAHAWQAWTTPLLWLLSVPTLLLVKPLAALRAAAYNRAVPLVALPPWRVAAHLAGRAGVFASLYAWPWLAFPAAPGKAAAFALVPIAVYSVWFMACSQVNHHTPETSHSFSPHWYRHQAATALNVAPASALAFYLSGGLNLQIEHHLLPGVNHAHLRALQPLVAAAAARHGVPYAVAPTIAGAFARLWAHLGELAVRPPRGEGAGGGGGASAAGSSAAEGETGGAARRERRGAKLD